MGILAGDYLSRPHLAATFRRAATERAAQFEVRGILDKLLEDAGLTAWGMRVSVERVESV